MSIFGSYIDPLADKVLVSVLTFSLTYVEVIPSMILPGFLNILMVEIGKLVGENRGIIVKKEILSNTQVMSLITNMFDHAPKLILL